MVRGKPERRRVDWAELRRRLDAAGEAASPAGKAEAAREVLERRARLLARPAAPPPAPDLLELLTFRVGDETCGIESRRVFGVFRPVEITPLPGAEPPVFGLTAWRGDLLLVLDLRPGGAAGATADAPGWIVVVGRERPTAGLAAHAIHDFVTARAEDVRKPPESEPRGRAFVRGITGGAVLVLDCERLPGFAGETAT